MPGLRVVTFEYGLLDGMKKVLVRRVGDGSIITRFEKTPPPINPSDVVCPHFLELKWATGCPFDCAWCYLKGTLRFAPYKTRPRLKDFGKIEQHVRAFLEFDGCGELLNSGELADSLMWEANGNPFSRFIINLFAGQRRHRVLFLTKSTNIGNLLKMSHRDRAVISFSLNACSVAERFERGAPAVKKRIEAAAKLAEAGFGVRLRIDPMVPVPHWEKQYEELIVHIFSRLKPERVTLGSLRGLQSTINQATDTEWVHYVSERSGWGKKVAFDTRYSMYSHIIGLLKAHDYHSIGLCKETLSIWQALGMDFRGIKCNCVL